ncbi:MAG: MFS transporter [Bifidobacterium crudilactis]|jgi:DHA3 family macrolide efflux protein-like MFS transporter|nr:MFS transporter [Bifidobacterium crudilactis]
MAQAPFREMTNWRRNSYLFLFSQFMTGITSMIVQYAIIWYLTQESGSATILSYATLLAMLPMVLLSPFVGTFIDRWNKKALLIVPDLVAAAFAVILSVVGTLNSTFPLWLVFVSLFVRSLAQAFQMPTIQSILPTIVPDDEITKINGQLGMVQSATMVVSPALGALLYAFIPINYLILADVLGAALGVGILAFISIPSNLSNLVEKPRVIADAVFGFKRIASARGLWSMLIISSLFTLMFMPAASLYPLMTFQYFKGSVFQAGVVEMVWSIGSLVGGAVIGVFGTWKDRMRPVVLAIAVLGVAFSLSGLLPGSSSGFVLFVILNAFAGMAIAFPSTLPMAMIQQSFPPDELGRVFGVCMSLSGLAGPIGLLFVGPLADALGVEWIFVLSGVGSLLCGLLMFAVPSTRLYDRRLQARLAAIPEDTRAEGK